MRSRASLLAIVIGGPLVALVLWIMAASGPLWWLWAWGAWAAFNLIALVLVPTLIAPLFNRFEPLKDASLEARVEALMARAGFAAKGLFVMDGSRRSAPRQRLLHRLRRGQARRLLRHPARPARARGGGGGAGARARPLQAAATSCGASARCWAPRLAAVRGLRLPRRPDLVLHRPRRASRARRPERRDRADPLDARRAGVRLVHHAAVRRPVAPPRVRGRRLGGAPRRRPAPWPRRS